MLGLLNRLATQPDLQGHRSRGLRGVDDRFDCRLGQLTATLVEHRLATRGRPAPTHFPAQSDQIVFHAREGTLTDQSSSLA
jgi:hypothetical protein